MDGIGPFLDGSATDASVLLFRASVANPLHVLFGKESQGFAVAAGRVDLGFAAVDQLAELAIQFLSLGQAFRAFRLEAAIGPEELEGLLELLAVGSVELVANDRVARSDLVAERRTHFDIHFVGNVEVECPERGVEEVTADVAKRPASVFPGSAPFEGMQIGAVRLVQGSGAFPNVPVETVRFLASLEL